MNSLPFLLDCSSFNACLAGPLNSPLSCGKTERVATTCNLFYNIAAKRVEKQFCAFHHPRSNLSCNKSSCKLGEYWLLITGSWITWESCHTHNLRLLLQKVERLSSFCNTFSQPDFLEDSFDSWLVKRAKSLWIRNILVPNLSAGLVACSGSFSPETKTTFTAEEFFPSS